MSAAHEPGYRRRIGYQAALLGIFSTLAAALLILGHATTHEAIAARQAEDLKASLSQVIPADLHDNNLPLNPLEIRDEAGASHPVYRATRSGAVTGVAYQVTAFGYGGAIEIILGVGAGGELLGVRVLSHAETPGLGDRIEVAKDDWILGFTGLSLGNPPENRWKVKKDGGEFDQFSGATITPRAVVGAIREGLKLFASHRDELLSPPVLNRASL
jgi:electron transport complex protein RnfG